MKIFNAVLFFFRRRRRRRGRHFNLGIRVSNKYTPADYMLPFLEQNSTLEAQRTNNSNNKIKENTLLSIL